MWTQARYAIQVVALASALAASPAAFAQAAPDATAPDMPMQGDMQDDMMPGAGTPMQGDGMGGMMSMMAMMTEMMSACTKMMQAMTPSGGMPGDAETPATPG